jgi:hypothetical protein
MNKSGLLLIVVILLCSACGSFDGEFGIKVNNDNNYRKINGVPEFSSEDTVAWIYRLKKGMISRADAGVILMKKELIWVDIYTVSDYFDNEKRLLYGVITGLDPGEYRLLITESKNDNKLIAEMTFKIYEEYDQD